MEELLLEGARERKESKRINSAKEDSPESFSPARQRVALIAWTHHATGSSASRKGW
jgi:hypothetical protein